MSRQDLFYELFYLSISNYLFLILITASFGLSYFLVDDKVNGILQWLSVRESTMSQKIAWLETGR